MDMKELTEDGGRRALEQLSHLKSAPIVMPDCPRRQSGINRALIS
jgi:hypothetical protein